jgi:ribonuclease HI
MGFRDLHSFNLAMLAKQSWRMLCNPESLCARVLRSKYFPDGNLLKAGPKKGSSFTWQSIVAGLQTFRRGHIWRIGTGSKVNIWEDHWIPTSVTRKVISQRGQCILRYVEELINPVTGQWDEDIIRQNLLQVDAEQILRIPLSTQLTEDFVAWQYTKASTFSVRSAYHIEWNHQFGSKVTRSDGQGSMEPNPVWEKLWKLLVPSKVNFFLWKALHGTLPGRAILADRHIKVHPQCPVCQLGPEDIGHLLFSCERANAVWYALGLSEVIDSALSVDRSGSRVLEYLLCEPDKKSPVLGMLGLKESIAVACWYIWWQRRELVNGGTISTPARSAFAINALTANFGSAKPTTIRKESAWNNPFAGSYKLNTDASFFSAGSGAVGAVLRNSKGEVVAGRYCPLDNLLSPASAEAMALLKGLELIDQLGCKNIACESDSLELVQACNGETDILSPYAAILADCFAIASKIDNISFNHCQREANQVAHQMAKYSYDTKESHAWDGDPPDFILPFIIRDVTLLTNL